MKNYLPKRKNIRLKHYDYSKVGLYFITICIKDRAELLGQITDAHSIELSSEGQVVKQAINVLEQVYPNVKIDEYVIMPNHIHLIIQFNEKTNITVSRIVQQFKWGITRTLGYSIWQKLFYEHVIRNEKEYLEIKNYIRNNIARWKDDCYF